MPLNSLYINFILQTINIADRMLNPYKYIVKF